MIRPMTIADVDNAMPLCREHFDAVNMTERFYTFHEATFKNTLYKLIKMDSSRCLVSERETIDGICIFTIFTSPFDDKDIKAVELLWYAKTPRIFVRLFDSMETLLNDIPVLCVGLSVNSATLQKHLKKKGFINTEITYSRRKINV
jgi:hypothetical protein